LRGLSRAVVAAALGLATACGGGPVAPPPLPAPEPSTTDRPLGGPRPFAAGARPEYRSPREDAISDADLDALWLRQLMVPVEGLSRLALHDDFVAKRDGNRIHGALDLLAPRLTAVLAADDCVIGRLATGAVGGIVIYAIDLSDQFVYYYAHLQHYRRGLAVGDTVAKGSVIGYVGTTGNAPPDTPHLHFQVMKRAAGRVWWDGPAINPLPFFIFDGVRP
jgi:peptidoglycan LD-endopeptidase LytH